MSGGKKMYLSMIETEEEKGKFIQVYEIYQYFMWYVANEILQDKHLAEDAVQEAFLALTRHLDKIDNVSSSRTRNFVATIVKSKAIDMIRKNDKNTAKFEEEILGESKEDLLEDYIQKEQHEKLVNAIGKLEDLYRVVFEYKYLYELKDKEIAHFLKVTPKVVNVRLYRGKKKLMEILKKEEEQNASQQ